MNHPPKNDAGSSPEELRSSVVLNVARAKKAAWVRASQREGKKLTDWIVERIESQPIDLPICQFQDKSE
jgi:hypothetical protein